MRSRKLVGVCVFLPGLASAGAPEERNRVPLYTNEDLQRVSAQRSETGGESQPAFPLLPPDAQPPNARGEEYWRREAERVRDRVEPLRQRVEQIRARIEERRNKPKVRPYSDLQIEAWEREVHAIEVRIREHESRFEDRARREGALPGWLR